MDVRELLLRARMNWETLRESQSGKDVQKEKLREAVVELRDSLLSVSVLIFPRLLEKGFKPEQVKIILDSVSTLREKVFDTYLPFLEVVHDNSTRRAGLDILLSTAPPIESLLTFLRV